MKGWKKVTPARFNEIKGYFKVPKMTRAIAQRLAGVSYGTIARIERSNSYEEFHTYKKPVKNTVVHVSKVTQLDRIESMLKELLSRKGLVL